jgi:DNA-binding response OmpR family regulator
VGALIVQEGTASIETSVRIAASSLPMEGANQRRRHVLIVEDEQIVALDLVQCLEGLGFGVTLATNGAGATAAIRRLNPDLVLMDIGLSSGMDGIEVAGLLRKDTDAALIFLTAHSDPQTIERAAKVKPWGYIVKPFHERAIAAAVHLALHRPPSSHFTASVIRIGRVKIDPAQQRIFLGDTEIRLTRKEFGILQFLVERAGSPAKPEAILERVWGARFAHYIQTLRVHIGNLRHKIETPASGVVIEVVRGIGYRLVESGSFPSTIPDSGDDSFVERSAEN